MTYLDTLFGLHGKTAVVTGGAGVIGTIMSKALLQAGANVVIWSRTQESVDSAMEKLTNLTDVEGKVVGMQVDTGEEDLVGDALKQVIDLGYTPDILVNGVGGTMGKCAMVDQDMDAFQKVLHLNLMAGFMIPTKRFAKYWIDNYIKGAIINLTSMTSYVPLSGVWGYDAAKSAVLNLTMGAANEFASHGIRVNAIAPGFFVGKQNRALLIDQQTGEYTERGKAILARTPYGRFGDVMELEGATVFLASDRASGFVTGVSIPVDGGYLINSI
jgi:NAD(P)-dependent dehydrogenase (short-subunit alcohol dehydrogenase family)